MASTSDPTGPVATGSGAIGLHALLGEGWVRSHAARLVPVLLEPGLTGTARAFQICLAADPLKVTLPEVWNIPRAQLVAAALGDPMAPDDLLWFVRTCRYGLIERFELLVSQPYCSPRVLLYAMADVTVVEPGSARHASTFALFSQLDVRHRRLLESLLAHVVWSDRRQLVEALDLFLDLTGDQARVFDRLLVRAGTLEPTELERLASTARRIA